MCFLPLGVLTHRLSENKKGKTKEKHSFSPSWWNWGEKKGYIAGPVGETALWWVRGLINSQVKSKWTPLLLGFWATFFFFFPFVPLLGLSAPLCLSGAEVIPHIPWNSLPLCKKLQSSLISQGRNPFLCKSRTPYSCALHLQVDIHWNTLIICNIHIIIDIKYKLQTKKD